MTSINPLGFVEEKRYVQSILHWYYLVIKHNYGDLIESNTLKF